MSDPAFSYLLRPGKFVDRALFVELLQYADRYSSMRDALYIGFGGPCMEDHRVIYGALGLKKLISIERKGFVYQQQKFNRPLREIICLHVDAKDFVDEFEAELIRAKVSVSTKKIVWFDYEAPEEIMHQLQTLQALIDLAGDGDIIRLTLNAHASSLGGARENEAEADLRRRRMEKLVERFGDFLPEGLDEAATQHSGYPEAVLKAIQIACVRSTSNSSRTFLPLLLVHYSDGQAMITVTGIVLPDDEVAAFLRKTGMQKWAYYADGWNNLEKVSSAPNLTLRERMHLDQAIMRNGSKLPSRLSYLTNLQNRAATEIVQIYRRYQRFFPRFQHVDL